MEECRNIICAHMKRGDPATNRFIDYCIMQSGSLQILVRDAKTGQIVRAPLGDERWLHRVKSGLGRASKNEWEVVQEVDRDFFEHLDHVRDWRFSFDSYYDVFIWDFAPGEDPMELFHRLVDVSYSPVWPSISSSLTSDRTCVEPVGLESLAMLTTTSGTYLSI